LLSDLGRSVMARLQGGLPARVLFIAELLVEVTRDISLVGIELRHEERLGNGRRQALPNINSRKVLSVGMVTPIEVAAGQVIVLVDRFRVQDGIPGLWRLISIADLLLR